MKDLIHSAKFLLFDLAGVLFFFLLYNLTHSMALAIIAGLVLALGQIGLELLRRKKVDTLQWVSLATVLAKGGGRPSHQQSALCHVAADRPLSAGGMGNATARLDDPLPAG